MFFFVVVVYLFCLVLGDREGEGLQEGRPSGAKATQEGFLTAVGSEGLGCMEGGSTKESRPDQSLCKSVLEARDVEAECC